MRVTVSAVYMIVTFERITIGTHSILHKTLCNYVRHSMGEAPSVSKYLTVLKQNIFGFSTLKISEGVTIRYVYDYYNK